MADERRPVGRPTKYTPELGKEICDTVSSTTKGLPTLCQMNDHWPGYNTIYDWINNKPDFSNMYAKAKEDQADYLCEDILRIIDKPETFVENGVERNDVAMMRLKVDSLKWQAMKLKPRRWGDKKEDDNSPSETLSKIQALVADLNKTNTSDI